LLFVLENGVALRRLRRIIDPCAVLRALVQFTFPVRSVKWCLRIPQGSPVARCMPAGAPDCGCGTRDTGHSIATELIKNYKTIRYGYYLM